MASISHKDEANQRSAESRYRGGSDPGLRKRERLVLDRAHAVLGDARRARSWLDRPNWSLSMETPKRLLRTKAGTESVLEVLDRILYGVYS